MMFQPRAIWKTSQRRLHFCLCSRSGRVGVYLQLSKACQKIIFVYGKRDCVDFIPSCMPLFFSYILSLPLHYCRIISDRQWQWWCWLWFTVIVFLTTNGSIPPFLDWILITEHPRRRHISHSLTIILPETNYKYVTGIANLQFLTIINRSIH